MKKACVLSYPLRAQRRLWSDWADAQASLGAQSFCWFRHEAAQIWTQCFLFLQNAYQCSCSPRTYVVEVVPWASIYEQTPQQLHPLGTRRDSGGHWDRKSPLLGSLIYEPPHDETNKVTVRPVKTQLSLGMRPVWLESSLCVQWVATG